MKSLEPQYLKKLAFSAEELASLTKLGEFKGKEELYNKQTPDTLSKLLENAIIESAESSSRIEGIVAPHSRVKKLVQANSEPKSRPEQEIAGYRDVLNLIHQSNQDIPLNENVILQFHSMLFRYTTKKSGMWKTAENDIVEKYPDGSRKIRFKTVSAFETPHSMEQLLELWQDYRNEAELEPLVLIPLFILDFLCIHPFLDGNGRIARLLTLLLLYQAGYQVGKYISLERIIEKTKESYYETLEQASQGWHKGRHDVRPWLNYFWGTLLGAYGEFEARVGVFRGKGSKTEQIKAQIERFVKPFAISDIERSCPNIGRDLIRKVLRNLRDNKEIRCTGKGRSAKWERLISRQK